jgi:anti-sigma regulatory factor (Ser/Thr protein kinase)
MAITERDLELPAAPASVRDARRFVHAALGALDADAVTEVASLLTSELVTNAIVHAGGTVVLRVTGSDHVVRIGVRDESDDRPQPRASSDSAQTGRGLGLVDRLAERWGVDAVAEGPGKEVWFELRI